MSGPDEMGAVLQHRPFVCQCAAITLYPVNAQPDKPSGFMVDDQAIGLRGQLPAMLHALMLAGIAGVENRQCRLFSVNPGHQVEELRNRQVQIDTVRSKGQPCRWVLRSQVQEVLA